MTDYKFSKQVKRFSIILTIIGAIGIAFGNPKFHKITPINQII